MESLNIETLQLIIGFVPGIVFGVFGARTFLKPKEAKRIAGSADNKLKLENEVLSDKVKQLEAKIQTLEKALEMATK